MEVLGFCFVFVCLLVLIWSTSDFCDCSIQGYGDAYTTGAVLGGQ